MNHDFFASCYRLDALGLCMSVLIAYVGLCVMVFASRYMHGDAQYPRCLRRMLCLIASMLSVVISDHLLMLWISLCVSYVLLMRLITHKASWRAARASGWLVAKNYLFSGVCMASASVLLYVATGQLSLHKILEQNPHTMLIDIALSLMLVATMAQSAIWPFQRWLLSSLNAPTPVSAMMHAGLINGGGFVLLRFAPLYSQRAVLMDLIFIIGIISAVMGTLWKLMQSDVKRMLACSTVAQMGFMFAQIGLGLFPSAIAHLFLHAMFKAYFLLASGGAAQEKRLDLSYPPKAVRVLWALLCGALGVWVCAGASPWLWDGAWVLRAVLFLAGVQVALSMLYVVHIGRVIWTLVVVTMLALVYRSTTDAIIGVLGPVVLMRAQPLNVVHVSAMVVLTLAWLCVVFVRNPWEYKGTYVAWLLKAYVRSLNQSQPHPATVTAYRKHYQYD